MPRLPRVPLPVTATEDPAPRPLAPPPAPAAYRQENPYEPPPAEYKAPSLFAEHKGLAIAFMIAVLAFAFYCLKPSQRPDAPAMTPPAAGGKPAPPEAGPSNRAARESVPGSDGAQSPIYIEAVPDKEH